MFMEENRFSKASWLISIALIWMIKLKSLTGFQFKPREIFQAPDPNMPFSVGETKYTWLED